MRKCTVWESVSQAKRPAARGLREALRRRKSARPAVTAEPEFESPRILTIEEGPAAPGTFHRQDDHPVEQDGYFPEDHDEHLPIVMQVHRGKEEHERQ